MNSKTRNWKEIDRNFSRRQKTGRFNYAGNYRWPVGTAKLVDNIAAYGKAEHPGYLMRATYRLLRNGTDTNGLPFARDSLT
jgi:hypothetical protein